MKRVLRLVGVVACAIALVGGPARAEVDQPAELTAEINQAIDDGVSWVKKRWKSGAIRKTPLKATYPCGLTALTYYTLRVCGVPREDFVAEEAYATLRKEYAAARRSKRLRTYTVALMMLAIEKHGEPLPGGRDDDRTVELDKSDTKWMEECVDRLARWQTKRGGWWYGGAIRGASAKAYDNSNTQFALLGLKGASRAGVEVPDRVWRRSLEHFVRTQQKDGPDVPRFTPGAEGRTSDGTMDQSRGWGYSGEASVAGRASHVYGSMTAGGVSSLVICRSELLGKSSATYPRTLDAKAEEAIRHGLAWLGANFTVAGNPGMAGGFAAVPDGARQVMAGPAWHHYFLYGMERAARLAQVDYLGEHDWYGLGARQLVDTQRSIGSWRVAGGAEWGDQGLTDTCFALLFLRRGTQQTRRGAITQALDETSINFNVARGLKPDDFESFIDLVLSRWRRVDDDAVRTRIAHKTAEVGPRVVFPLLKRLGSTNTERRQSASEALHAVTGLIHGFDPLASAEEREPAVMKWEEWYLLNGTSLRYDETTKRVVVVP